MKKYLAAMLALICLFGLMGCTASEKETAPDTEESAAETTTAEAAPVLTVAPRLTVTCGQNSIVALGGTTSWSYLAGEDTWVGIDSDSSHPLEAKEYMTPLALVPSAISSVHPLDAWLLWDTVPDKVTVTCWSEACWGNAEAEGETVSATESSEAYTLRLKDGNYIYEVVAEWSGAETYRGVARYSFYTVARYNLNTDKPVGSGTSVNEP